MTDQNTEVAEADQDVTDLLNDDAAPEPQPAPRQVRRRTAKPRPTEPLYSIAQVARIIDFTTEFDGAEEWRRTAFFAAFGWSEGTDADGLEVATALQANPEDIEAFHLYTNLWDKVSGGRFEIRDIIALVGQLSQVDFKVLASFSVFVNSVVPEDHRFEIRKNTPAADVLTAAHDGLAAIENKGHVNTLNAWYTELIEFWPGNAE